MKGMSGLDTLNAMRQEGVTARIVILTVSDAKQDVIRLLRAVLTAIYSKTLSLIYC